MKWNTLNNISQLDTIDASSAERKILIMKHSTRCSISSLALNRLENKWQDADNDRLEPYYLDLLTYRPISNAIAERYGVEHESPQVLIISKGKCIYTSTHTDINYDDIMGIAGEI
jgi:bacillithiol system protein YtxJ